MDGSVESDFRPGVQPGLIILFILSKLKRKKSPTRLTPPDGGIATSLRQAIIERIGHGTFSADKPVGTVCVRRRVSAAKIFFCFLVQNISWLSWSDPGQEALARKPCPGTGHF